MKRKVVFAALSMILVIVLFSANMLQCYAHGAMLTVKYDGCGYNPEEDEGINETWYSLLTGSRCYHLSHEQTTIKYYFAEKSDDGIYGWTDTISLSEANQIKEAYANSMKKWNDIYYYSYTSDGVLEKKKIINVVEGTAEDHNLTIYPAAGTQYIASTQAIAGSQLIEGGSVTHKHYDEWKMKVYVYYFSSNNTEGQSYINVVRERTGAHELGHVLGLFDVDNECTQSESTDHHHEILMGYGSPIIERAEDITYKDIAGAAITRGFHTDDNHMWLNCGQINGSLYKLICSICNGVKFIEDLNGISYHTYESCNNNHAVSSGNMMAVASYGDCDYYKCKFCRYVAPFSDIVQQDYEKTYYNSTVHRCRNDASGLGYVFFEEHQFNSEHVCIECGEHGGPFTYDEYTASQHKIFCECGHCQIENHVYNRKGPTTSIYHSTACVCGSLNTQSHIVDTYVAKDNDLHYVYCECGYLIETDTHTMVAGWKPGTSACRKCGYIRDDSGLGNVIMGDEDEMEND